MPFGPSEKIDGTDGANKTNRIGMADECEENACKAFSKDLILYTILQKSESDKEEVVGE